MKYIYIYDGICIVFGCYGGVLVYICFDDLLFLCLKGLLVCNNVLGDVIEDVIIGCIN